MTLLEQLQALGFNATEKRGKVWLGDFDVARIVDGVPVSLTRRRYGTCTMFCWAHAYLNGRWVDLGDPWQKVTPSADDLTKAMRVLADTPSNLHTDHFPN